MTRLNFFVEGIKKIRTTGTITRSSSFVSKEMIKHADMTKAKCIVELGAGDGVITKHILKAMKPETQLLAFEVLKPFCDELRAINDKRLNVVEDSAEYLRKYLDQANADYADYIISAIPFVALPEKLGDSIIQTAFDNLRPGGLFIQLNYSLIPKKRYERFFSKVDVHFVPLNIPPAFVMVCHKAK